jgi:hypothetical protein
LRKAVTEVEMMGKVGDRIVVESESVGQPTREGEILEVIEGEVGLRYRVRWVDGHESMFTPSGGAARIIQKKRKATAKR